MARRRWRRRILGALLGSALVGAGAVALVPTALNRGAFRGTLERAVSDAVGAPVRIGTLELSWFDAQEVRGLHVADGAGGEAAALDVRVKGSLLALVFGSAPLDATISGTITAEVREDGTTSLDGILGRDDSGAPDEPGVEDEPPAGEPAHVPALRIALAQLDIAVRLPGPPGEEGAGASAVPSVPDELRIDDLTGVLSLMPGATATMSLNAAIESGGRQGTLSVTAKAERVLDTEGAITLEGASLDTEFVVEQLGVPAAAPLPERIRAIERAVVRITSDDLARTLALDLEADTRVEDDALETLRGRLAVDHGTPRPFELAVEAPYAAAELRGIIEDDGTIRAGDGAATARVAPEVLAAIAGLDAEGTVTVAATIASLVVPGARADGSRDLDGIELDARIELRESARLARAGEPWAIESLVIDLDAAPLRDGFTVYGVLVSDVGGVTISERLEDIVVDGAVALGTARPIGHLRLQDVDLARVAALAARTDLVERLAPLEVARLDARIETRRADAGVALTAEFTGTAAIGDAQFALEARGVERSDALDIEMAQITGALTPQLIRGLQAQRPPEERVQLEMPSPLRLDVERLRFPRNDDGIDWGNPQLMARVTSEALAVAHPQLAETLRFRSVDAELAAGPDFLRFALARTEVEDAATGRAIATFDATLAAAPDSAGAEALATEDGWAGRRTALFARTDAPEHALDGVLADGRWAARIDASVASADLARTLGRDAESLERWLGPQDDFRLTVAPLDDRTRIALETTSARIGVAVELVEEPDAWVIESGAATIPLGALGASGVVGDPSGASTEVRLDGPVALEVTRARLPKALLASEPLAEGQIASLDAAVRPTEVLMHVPGRAPVRCAIERGSVRTADLAAGLQFGFAGALLDADRTGAADAGRFELDGSVTHVLDANGLVAETEAMRLDATLHADRLPTVVLDALAELDGLLVAAAGETISADLDVRDFSRTSGRVDLDVTAESARLGGRLNAQEHRLFSAGSNPMHGTLELTPPFRDRLLAQVHPLLADVRTVEQPIEATLLKGFAIPLDGEISALNGDLEITIGAVELDSGSVMLGLLSLFKDERATIPAYIEPIAMKIRKGVVRTQRFVVRVDDRLELAFAGDVDLNTRTADLRTEIPLSALADTVEETRGYVDDVVIPIVYRGPLDDLKPEVDPDYDFAGATLESTIDNALRGVLEKQGLGDVGGLIGDLIKGAGKKEGGG